MRMHVTMIPAPPSLWQVPTRCTMMVAVVTDPNKDPGTHRGSMCHSSTCQNDGGEWIIDQRTGENFSPVARQPVAIGPTPCPGACQQGPALTTSAGACHGMGYKTEGEVRMKLHLCMSFCV